MKMSRVTEGQLRSHSNCEQVQGHSGEGHRADGPLSWEELQARPALPSVGVTSLPLSSPDRWRQSRDSCRL